LTLFVKEITSIGAVDSGDNPEADIVFWKKASAASAEQAGSTDMDLASLPEAVQEHIAELTKERDDAVAALVDAEVVDLTDEDPVEKASDEVQELVAKLRTEADEQRAALEAEIAKRRDIEFTKRVADDGLDALLGKAEDVGPTLRRLADADAEAFDSIYANLVAAAQRDGLSKAFDEIGENAGESDPVARRDAWVAKRKEDGDDRSVAALNAAFWDAHPAELAKSREDK
jgi:hypothetical protein